MVWKPSPNPLDYFYSTYVNGTVRTIQRLPNSHGIEPIRSRKNKLVFPPTVWNVHDATLAGNARTNNFCESWNNGFASLVGHCHPSLWVLIGAIQKNEGVVSTAIVQDARGQPPVKRVKKSSLPNSCRSVCCSCANTQKTE